MLGLIQDLCRSASGSKCNMPRLSSWSMIAPGQTNVSVDVADVGSGGAGAVAPVNIKAYGSHFRTGLASPRAAMSSQMQGFGVGAGVGAGWGVPVVGANAMGKMPKGIKKAVIERVSGTVQNTLFDQLKGLADGATGMGVSGGTRIIAGPNVAGDLTLDDFHGSYATVVSLGANFVVNGVSAGLLIVSKSQPVIQSVDLIHATAFGLVAGVGLATSLDLEASGMVYTVGFG